MAINLSKRHAMRAYKRTGSKTPRILKLGINGSEELHAQFASPAGTNS
jgi:hypothetical protein